MRKGSFYLVPLFALLFSLALSAGPVPAQESATPEVEAATPPPKKAPTLKDVVKMVNDLQRDIRSLQSSVQALQVQVDAMGKSSSIADLDRRVRALEQTAVTDVYRDLDIPRGMSLETWHREMHRRDSSLRLRTERELEDWHRAEHQRRRDLQKW